MWRRWLDVRKKSKVPEKEQDFPVHISGTLENGLKNISSVIPCLGGGGLVVSGAVIGGLDIWKIGLLLMGVNGPYFIFQLIRLVLWYKLKKAEQKAEIELRKKEQEYDHGISKEQAMNYEAEREASKRDHEYRMEALKYGKGQIGVAESENQIAQLDGSKFEKDSQNVNMNENGSNGNEPDETIHRIK